MRQLNDLRKELDALLQYELVVDDFTTAEKDRYLNLGYNWVSEMTGLPILARETNYNVPLSSPLGHNWSTYLVFDVRQLELAGLKHIYRLWFEDAGKWREIKPGVILEPQYDEVFEPKPPTNQPARKLPSPLSEMRLTYPRLKMLTGELQQTTKPNYFLFTGETLMFDAHPQSGEQTIRLIGSFAPSSHASAAVKLLSNDADQTLVPDFLDDAIVMYAAARILMGYPDALEVATVWLSRVNEIVLTARNQVQSSLGSYSPLSTLETLSGIALNPEEPKRKR